MMLIPVIIRMPRSRMKMDGHHVPGIWPNGNSLQLRRDGSPSMTDLVLVSFSLFILCTCRDSSRACYIVVALYKKMNILLILVLTCYALLLFFQFWLAGKPAIGGPWSLVDLEGNLVTNTNFEGKWILLYFGFARCPDICPSEMMKVGRVMDTLKKDHPNIANNTVPVFVSIDPARDSLKALKEYAKDFHPDYIFLTGTPQQVKQMAKSYRVYYSKADESVDGDYLVDHSIVIYFHDTTGDLADCFTQSMRPSDVVEKIVERYNAAMKSATTAVTA
jgi:protein SCO1